MFWLFYITVNIQNAILWLEYRHGVFFETTAPVGNAIVNMFCLKKNGKTTYVFSCVKLMFITCDKKINIVNIFIYALKLLCVYILLLFHIVSAFLCEINEYI